MRRAERESWVRRRFMLDVNESCCGAAGSPLFSDGVYSHAASEQGGLWVRTMVRCLV